MEEMKYFAIVIVVALASLSVIAVTYHAILKQDSVVITTISALIGSIVGYYFKLLKDKISRGE